MWKEFIVNFVFYGTLFIICLFFNGGIDRFLKALGKNTIPYKKVYKLIPYWKYDLNIGNTKKYKVLNEQYKSKIAPITIILGFTIYIVFIIYLGFSLSAIFTDSILVSNILLLSEYFLLFTTVTLLLITTIFVIIMAKKNI